ncbi:R3H and coiled-coil domain-containing protein 1 isoform X1 [Scleropages formosus]|uniref:R3H and coiled-coil domain-containing protein 1 isoform X1 n=1 Tax=Scleropages formosus TaxID=113540 RepID=UPI0008785067|nr:R3H and coiled-coil domain-containing protein 1 isoform X1 [Scleropages formosus]XP_018608207.1 R3H and coiled-coil domain-containing protein 1 isoform X1 [Scleropages formosus]XP_018608217.1 R3H and coiled-coil domain-containing protein 1 isoform X1 [Scleropages formosus]XP_018608225.1 R3H and coiled-coil domain-containing protein 1 isoform X1 [Scleropages formosus]XP_018608235.1 R3H and coiled-coil domain-containing protein 1 isoform X1 [Scleropages formosus]
MEAFLQAGEEKSVLLFPPLPSRLRFLIHKAVEKYPPLSTFSVGEGWSRRVVVCYSHLRLPLEREGEADADAHKQAPGRDRATEGGKGSQPPEPRRMRSRGTRRPDKAIYVPRAMRIAASQGPDQVELNPPSCTLSPSAAEESCPDAANEKLPQPPAAPDESAGKAEVSDPLADPETPPAVLEETVSYFISMSLDSEKEDSSGIAEPATSQVPGEAKEDPEDFTREIVAHLREMDITIQSVHNEYSSYNNMWIGADDFAHVIEIYDFPAVFKTEDLLDAFADFSKGGLKIKWVDDTHALGVFSSVSAAQQALSIRHPMLKARTLSEGSSKSKGKALRRAEFIQPVKERPRTDTAVARRMVTRALGLQRGGPRGKRY